MKYRKIFDISCEEYPITSKPESIVSHDLVRGTKARPLSQLWYCYKCGKVWAKVEVRDIIDNSLSNWIAYRRECFKCHIRTGLKHHYILSGSLILPETNEIKDLPGEVLNREILIVR